MDVMIVRTAGDRIQLITQPDHAHLARAIMEECEALASNPRRDAILLAVGEHDNGWTEVDASPVLNLDTGRIVDFVTAPLRVRHEVWPRAVARLSANPWAAALVAQHAVTVYDRFRSSSDWSAFFSEMERLRDDWRRASRLPLDDLIADYAFVRLGDLISLTFYTGWSDPQHFRDWTVVRSGTRVMVTPDLFGGRVVPMEVTATEIQDQPFPSDVELRRAMGHATRITLRGEVATHAA
jgi:hypothetical protein